MIAANPCEDMPSVEAEACDIGGCGEPWAWEAEKAHGPRKLRLCESHADRWLKGAAELEAEKLAIIAAAAQDAAVAPTEPPAPHVLPAKQKGRGARPATGEIGVIANRVDRLAGRLSGSLIAGGGRPRPGTAKALDSIGRGNDKRRRARRGLS